MALSPLPQQRPQQLVTTPPVQPSKTYGFDIGQSRFTGQMVDGVEAVKQFITKALHTPRYRYLVYSHQYGSEVYDLIGQNLPMELLEVEIPRLIKEALIYDDRIMDVTDFSLTRVEDKLYVDFTVILADQVRIPVTEVFEHV